MGDYRLSTTRERDEHVAEVMQKLRRLDESPSKYKAHEVRRIAVEAHQVIWDLHNDLRGWEAS